MSSSDAVWLPQDNITGCGWHYTDLSQHVRGQGSTVEAFVASPLTVEALSAKAFLDTLEARLCPSFRQNLSIFLISGSKQIIKCSSTHSFQKIIPVEFYRIHSDIETLA
ncbi:hypothetical protein YC2023_099306 [Brassica napus]